MSVLITNADYKNTLAAIRSLGKRGIDISVAGHRPLSISFYSKYCKNRNIYFSPRKKHIKFAANLLKIIKEEKIGVLFPVGVNTTVPVSYYKEKFLPFVKVPVADYDTLVKAHDKSICLEIAKKCSIPIPKTYYPKSFEEVADLAEKIQFPTIIKRRKGSGVEDGIRLVSSKTELINKYREIEDIPCDSLIDEQKFPMIQEYVPGEIRDVCVLFNRGKPKAVLVQRRVWTWPPEGGPGILNETIHDPHLRDLALRLLEKIKWHGLAQVEFKLDAEGKPRLMEVNPKFWGTLELSIKAGIDFPYLLYEMSIHGDVDPVFDYKKMTFLWVFPSDIIYMIKTKNKFQNLKFIIEQICKKNTATDISLSDIKPELIKPWHMLIRRIRPRKR